MSTVQEIQEAIAKLPQLQRFALLNWLHSNDDVLSDDEEAEILAEAEVGARQIDEGKGVSLDALRNQTRTWTTKS